MPAASTGANAAGFNPANVRGVETYVMSDTANTAIPLDIRQQFQTDEQGRVLFFTAPPIDRLPRVDPTTGNPLSHSAAYLAKKLEKETAMLEAETKAKEAEETREPGKLTSRELASLTPKQRKFLQLSHGADARVAREQEAREQALTQESILRNLLLDNEDWWKARYEQVKDGLGGFKSYEEFRAREAKLFEYRKQQWKADDETKASVRSQCNGAMQEMPAIENARKRLREEDVKIDEKVKLRRVIADFERKTYQKPVYLDDLDPRYGPI